MKLVGIGDIAIPGPYIKTGFASFSRFGVEIECVEWEVKDREALQDINIAVEQRGSDAYEVGARLLEAVRDADIIITHFCPVNTRVIDNCAHLKVIGVLRGGIENVNLAYATSKGIAVYNTPGRNADAVADFTVGGLICECRNIARGYKLIREGGWHERFPNWDVIPDLPGKTVGIIGLGAIGTKVAKRLAAFDMKILAYDPYFHGEPPYGIEMTTLEDLLSRSDFVTVHARLTPETYHLLNAERLALMKPGAYFINTARSGLVDQQALYELLKARRIMGAFLDVFDEEPTPAQYPLVMLDNVTATPHLAGGTVDTFLTSPAKLAADMVHLFEGQASRNLLNKEVLDRIKPAFARRQVWEGNACC